MRTTPRGWTWALGIALAALAATWAWRSQFLERLLPPPQADKVESVAYAIGPERWTRFNIAEPRGLAKLLSNAVVSVAALPKSPQASDGGHRYAIEYRVEEAGGRLIEQGKHYYRGDVLRYFDPPGGQWRPTSWLADEDAVAVATAQLRHFDFGARRKGVVLALRLASPGAGVKEVLVRPYTRERLAEDQRANRWLRLTHAQQSALAEETVYPPELLDRQETLELVHNRWRPLGPQGVEGEDYQIRQLRSLAELPSQALREPTVPAGLYVDAGRRGVVPLPPAAGLIEIRAVRPEWPGLPVAAAAPIRLHWRGETALQREQRLITDPARPLLWRGEFPPGLLEIEVAEPLVLRIFRLAPGTAPQELTPEPQQLRLYQVDAGSPIRYRIDHDGDQPTPFRLDLRMAVLEGALPEQAPALRYELHGEDGTLLGSHSLTVGQETSAHDRPVAAMRQGRVSVVTSHYFRLAPAVRRFSLQASAPVWAVAYTRPADLAHRVNTGSDYQPWASSELRQPAWFLIRPDHSSPQDAVRASLLLDRQTPPTAEDADIAAGQYDWEHLRPADIVAARELLSPLTDQAPPRAEARGAVFRPLAAGLEHRLVFAAGPGQIQLSPRLLYSRESAGSFSVSVWIDGRQLLQRQLSGDQGELRLPPLSSGAHRLRIEASAEARWSVNYAGSGGPGSQLLREAHRLQPGAVLRYAFDKRTPGRETLSGRVFLPQPGASAVLRLRVGGGAPVSGLAQTGWTLGERLYRLQAQTGEWAQLLEAPLRRVPGSARLFAALMEDLPPGRYPVELSLDEGSEVYVQLFTIRPGVATQREVLKYQLGENP